MKGASCRDMQFSNEKLFSALATGTERERRNAFDYILNQAGWSKMATSFVLKRGGTREEAEEVFFDALYFFDRNLRQGDYKEEGNVEAYFINIVARQWGKRAEKNRRQLRLFDFFLFQKESEEINREELEWYERKETVEYLNKLIASMGKHCSDILRLYQLGYSLEETASEMGLGSVDRVKNEKKRCIQRTREQLKQNPAWKNLFKN